MSLWSQDELVAAVNAYLSLLKQTEQGQSFNKNACYRELSERFPKRSIKAFEYRMQNISYVMHELGRPWLTGLKPAKNVGAKVSQQLKQIIAYCEAAQPLPVLTAEAQAAYQIAPLGVKKPAKQNISVVQYARDEKVKAWVLNHAQGHCECCASPAPFITEKELPYLEVHHLRQLAHGGSDTVGNCVALCPNCHRALHHSAKAQELRQDLYQRLARLRPE